MSYDPAILFIYWGEMKTNGHKTLCKGMFIAMLFVIAKDIRSSSFAHQKRMHKQNVVYSHNGILFSN